MAFARVASRTFITVTAMHGQHPACPLVPLPIQASEPILLHLCCSNVD
jgi:hypothetical protein